MKKIEKIKAEIKNYLALNGITILILTMVASCYQGCAVYLSTIYEIFLTNLWIMVGIWLLGYFESSYYFIEIAKQVGLVGVSLLGAGYWFQWNYHLPIFILMTMGIGIYILCGLINIWKVQRDIDWINHTLDERQNMIKKKM